MKIYIITQNFPPSIGGIQTVMYSIAKDLSSMGNEVFVFPDRWFKMVESFKVKNVIAPKLFRHYIKRLLLSINGQEEGIIICDTWKSINAVPKKFKNIVLFAHGQEYLKLKNKKRILSSLIRAKLVIASSKYTYNLIKNNWNIQYLNLNVLYPTYHIKKLSFKKTMLN